MLGFCFFVSEVLKLFVILDVWLLWYEASRIHRWGFCEYVKRTRCKSKSNTHWDLKFWFALSNSSLLIQRLLCIRWKFSLAKWSCWFTLKYIALGGFRSRWFVWNIARDEMLKLVHYWLIVRANWFSNDVLCIYAVLTRRK